MLYLKVVDNQQMLGVFEPREQIGKDVVNGMRRLPIKGIVNKCVVRIVYGNVARPLVWYYLNWNSIACQFPT